MEIKNFANGFSSGRAKILTAILGCLAVGCVAIILSGVATDKNIATAYTFHDNICVTAYDTTKDVEKSTCNGFAEGDYACYDGYDGYAVRCNGRYWKDVKSWSQPKCYCKSQYANYAHIEYGKDIKITSAAPAATGTGGATSGEVKKLTFQDNAGTACVYSFNPQFASGKNGECRGNTYCFPYPAAFATEGGVGRCDIGCAIRDDGGNILDWYELGQTTCKKSGTNLTKSAFGTSLPDGVYECKKMSPSGDGAVTWKHNGAVWVEGRSSSITNDYYAFDLKNNCLTCQEDTKGNAYCRDNANNTNNTKCDEIKSRIQNQFSNYVKDTNYCRNSPTKESSKTWGEHYYNCYHGAGGVRERYINAFKDNGALSGAGGIIRVFERLAYPGGWRYGDKTMIETQGTFNFPNQTQVIGDNDILCDFNTTDGDGYLINKECNATVSGMNNYLCVGPASTLSSPFKGNSGGRQYQCARVDIGGGISCGMYNWVKNQSYVSCNSGRVEQFGTGGYFRKDSSGKPSYGWGKGADENGCEYISFANASGFLKTGGDDKEASSYSYREMRMPTGYCYGKSQAQIEGTAVCAAIAGPTGGKTETPGAGEAKISSYQLTYSEGKLSHKITFSGDIRSCQFNFARKEGSACVFNYRGDVKRMADEVLGISEAVFEKSAQGAAFVANKSTDMTKELAETAPDKLPITFDCEVVCQDTLGNSHYGKGSIALGSSEDAPKEGGLYDCNHNTFGPIKIGARICGVNNPGLFQCLGSSVKGGAGEWLPVDCEDERGEGWVDDCANKNPQCVLKSEAQSGEKLICKDNNDCYEKSGRDYYCLYKGLGGEIGFCSKEGGCFSPSNGNKNFYKGVIVCGGNGTSQYCANPTNPPSVSGWARTPDQNCPEDKGVCNRDTGFCEGGTATQGDCKLSSLNAGGPRERKSSCSGIYVPFTLNHQGDCSGKISCEVYDDYNQKTWPANCQSSDLLKTSSSNWEACVSVKSRYGDSGGSQVVKSAEIPDKINFEIECCLSDGSCVSGRSDYGNPFAKEDQEKKKEQEKSKEGGACETDKDCQEGLVCVDKKCVKKEDADKQKEEEKQNSIAPNVTISSPSGTIDTKTAQLSVTTDIAANCKYMLNQEGGLSAGNFDGAGMVLSGAGGTSHTATLSNLTNIQAANCKYNHSVTVLCKNSKASAGATSAIGSAQTNFSVDLSQKTENAPVVTAAMEQKYTIANPVLKVISDRPADCEYKKDSDFTFGGGTKFDTTGSYSHNTQLNDLKNGDHTYYVVCQDKTTCAANKPGLSVKFKVDLSEDPASAPNIVSTTPEIQTVANPTLSVTTDRPAACQYKKDATFTYDGGTQFPNDGEYAHSVPLADLPDGKYTFYVACKDKATGAKKTLETAIVTTLNRGGTAGAPVISNTTPPSQNTNNPTLSVITDRAAVCQYKKDADFVYGQGLPFTVTGGTGHSVVLNNVPDGPQTYYVVCQDPATQAFNSPGAQIIFAVNTAAETCASLSSNDKQNDNERSYGDEGDYNSIYLWRAASSGTVEMFEKVDWHAGYQFTPEADGYATELCGYFESGARNRVSLYNGSYKELAGVDISGEGGWSCVNIAPAAVKAGKRYYVIARVQDDSIYFAYKSGLLPREVENATIDAGIRQLAADGKFGESLKKYDYMVFGLVDAKIKFAEESSRGPKISELLPDGDREKGSVVLLAKTDEDADCKFDREDLEYKNMKYTFGATGQKLHQQKVCNLSDGPFTWYVRCKGAADTNDSSSIINFKVDD